MYSFVGPVSFSGSVDVPFLSVTLVSANCASARVVHNTCFRFCSAGVFAVVLFVVRLVVQQLAFLGVYLSFSSTLTNFDSDIVEVIELA